MAASQLLRLGSIVESRGGILVALKHNKRNLPKDKAHIDATRTPLNYSLTSDVSAEAVARYAKSQMALAGIDKPRKNGVMAVEVVFSLPIEWHQQDTRQFFVDCYKWVKQNFAGELLAFDIHLDESAPHAHAVILPLIDGKMRGDMMKGNRANIARLNDLFHSEVSKQYGFKKISGKRLSSSDKQTIERLILEKLKDDPVMLSSVWACVRDLIRKDPMLFAQALSITASTASAKKTKSFVDHKRSKGKGSFIK